MNAGALSDVYTASMLCEPMVSDVALMVAAPADTVTGDPSGEPLSRNCTEPVASGTDNVAVSGTRSLTTVVVVPDGPTVSASVGCCCTTATIEYAVAIAVDESL